MIDRWPDTQAERDQVLVDVEGSLLDGVPFRPLAWREARPRPHGPFVPDAVRTMFRLHQRTRFLQPGDLDAMLTTATARRLWTEVTTHAGG